MVEGATPPAAGTYDADMVGTSQSLDPLEAAAEFRRDRGWEILDRFAGLLSLPNVTGDLAALRVNAAEIRSWFVERGGDLEVVALPGAGPVVIGTLAAPEATATLGVYVHFDGQPVDPDEWETGPFEVALASEPWHTGGEQLSFPGPGDEIDPEWRIYARGASDDKTPFAALTAALDALAAAGIDRRVDLVFLFEGEEESGSPHLGDYMAALSDRLQADGWLLCDGPVHQSRAAQISFGVRGYCGFDLTVYGPERELHSGHYGNWVPNPALELASLLAGCKDANGRVTIEDFYADTIAQTAADRDAIERLPAVEDRLQEELGFGGAEVPDAGYAERLMLPSFNVRGLRAAGVGSAARNVVPAMARASVDIRLAAGDVPARMLDRVQAHFEQAGYVVLDREPTAGERRRHRHLARMDRDPGYRAARVPMDAPLARLLLDAARTASGAEVVALPTFGGSVPLYRFEELLDAPVVIVPIANHDNNQHAANENIRVGNLWYGMDLWATILTTNFSAVADSTPARG
jgi:acetylornithine deacetylase/succinyl-diaminopimelate desuccinylase-like protein